MVVGLVYDPPTLLAGETEERQEVYDHRVAMRQGVTRVLREAGHGVVPLPLDDDALRRLREAKVDIVFNLSCGIRGPSRQSFATAILDHLALPYTGSNTLAHAVGLHKPTTKKLFLYNHVPTPPFQVFARPDESLDPQLRFPLVVKPVQEGFSLGVTFQSLVYEEVALRHQVAHILQDYRQPALVEEYIAGREFSVGLVGNHPCHTLPILEIDFTPRPPGYPAMRTFEVKTEQPQFTRLLCPAPLSTAEEARIHDAAIRAYRAVGAEDFARVDLRLGEEGTPYVLEINTLPGLDPHFGSFSVITRAAGWRYDDLILTILDCACQRWGLAH